MLTLARLKESLLLRCARSAASSAYIVEFKGKLGKKSGQSAVEYILLVAFISLIFGVVFTSMRQNLFNLWVCEMAPRIQSPVPCNNGSECFDHANDTDTKGFCY